MAPSLGASFHTTSLRGDSCCSEVPPTPVTYGWLAGSWTVAPGCPLQALAPVSPDAAKIVWPWAAASSNSVFSACAPFVPSVDSQLPQEVETTSGVTGWLIIC